MVRYLVKHRETLTFAMFFLVVICKGIIVLKTEFFVSGIEPLVER